MRVDVGIVRLERFINRFIASATVGSLTIALLLLLLFGAGAYHIFWLDPRGRSVSNSMTSLTI